MNTVKKIISGGQSGADLAGNVFAREMGIKTCINSFRQFHPQDRDDEDLYLSFEPNFPIMTTSYVKGLRERTRYNVEHSDATLIFVLRSLTPGSNLTRMFAEDYRKPCAVLRLTSSGVSIQIRDFLTLYEPVVLNIAGSRDCNTAQIVSLLREAWKLMGVK